MPDFNFSEPVNFELLSFADRYGAYLSQKETAPADETEKKVFEELLRICKKETAKVIFRKFDEYFNADEWDDNRQSGKKYSYFQFYLRDRSGWGRTHAVHFELKEIKREKQGLFLPAGYSIYFHVEDKERKTFTEDKINALENKKIQFSEYLKKKYDDGTSFPIDYSSEKAFEQSVDNLVGEIFRDAVLKYYKEIDAIING